MSVDVETKNKSTKQPVDCETYTDRPTCNEDILQLEELLGRYTCRVPLNNDEGNRYQCGHCKSACRAVKSTSYCHLPLTLVVHLKKFRYCKEAQGTIKIEQEVSYPNHGMTFGDAKFDLLAVLV